MNDAASLVGIIASAALVATPPILLTRFLTPGEGASLGTLLAIPADPPWPRGAQEEEPRHWRLETIELRKIRVPRRGDDSQPRALRGSLVERAMERRECA